MKIRALLLLSFCTFYSVFFSQEEQEKSKGSFREKFEAANSLMEDNLYEFAKDIWLELLIENVSNANINYKVGFCLLKSANDKKEAFKYLNIAKTDISNKYSPIDHTVTSSPIEVYYYLGKSFHLNYQPDSAISYFNKFIEQSGKKTLFT
jgi:tetratricopeptide (TPR) repeat protein